MNSGVFGDLQEWDRVLDRLRQMRENGTLDNHQHRLAQLAQYPFNWQLRQAALRAIAELKRPADEVLQIAVQIVVEDNFDLGTRILAVSAVSAVLGNGNGASISNDARNKAVKSIKNLLEKPQTPVVQTLALQCQASLQSVAKAATTSQSGGR
jgi:hypothetical protein